MVSGVLRMPEGSVEERQPKTNKDNHFDAASTNKHYRLGTWRQYFFGNQYSIS